MSEPRYYARPASDRSDDGPWFVADNARGGLNVTADLTRGFVNPWHRGGVLLSPAEAIVLAVQAGRAAAPFASTPEPPVYAIGPELASKWSGAEWALDRGVAAFDRWMGEAAAYVARGGRAER